MLDPALRGFVEAADEAEAEGRLAALLEDHAAPLIRSIAGRKMEKGGAAVADLEDIVADALLALVARLQALRAEPGSAPIGSLSDYVAVVAHNAFAHYLRRRYPERSRLKLRLRYVLTRDRRFALWATPEALACGLAAWRQRGVSPEAMASLERMGAEPVRLVRSRTSPMKDPGPLLDAVFRAAGGPVDFDRLVGVVADVSLERGQGQRGAADVATLPDHAAVPQDVALGQRQMTERLWREIGSLPVRQRLALLLGLRDVRGASLLWVLPLTGTASIRQIARALEMPDLELAELWNRLPLDDRAIAARLGLARQQVINLRSAARKRLSHRLETGNLRDVSASLEDKE